MAQTPPIYLDYAAATPLDPGVITAMQPYLSEQFYNPSANYLAARKVAQDIEKARGVVAHWLGARRTEITFTAGGTEANNLAIHGIMRRFPQGNIVVSEIEHESVLGPARAYDVRIAPVLPDGRVNVAKLGTLIDDQTVLVSVMQANNEVGAIQPIRDVAKLVRDVRKLRSTVHSSHDVSFIPIYFHTDACQAAAYLGLKVARLGVDMLTINAGKIYGPKQVGALYIRTGTMLEAQLQGGGQEAGLRSGSENVAGIIGFAAALEIVQQRRLDEVRRLRTLQTIFFDLLKAQSPAIVINGSLKHRLPNNIHITLHGTDNERILLNLEEAGILCAAGSACSAAKGRASHVLTALGLDEQTARASLRLTMGYGTTVKEVRYVAQVLERLQVNAKALY